MGHSPIDHLLLHTLTNLINSIDFPKQNDLFESVNVDTAL